MTLPVPAPTDPMADGALHIRNLAEAVDNRLNTGYVVRTFDTGVQTCNADGSITAGAIPGLATISGCISGPVYVYQNSSSAWMPVVVRDPNTGAVYWARCFNAPTNTPNVGKSAWICGIAWGPPTATALTQQDAAGDAPAAEPAAGTFPRGTTPKAKLRYPGTNEPQYRTAAAIGDLADDIGKALGGTPQGLALSTRVGVWTTGNAGYFEVDMAPELGLVRGAVATAWDATGAYPGTYLFTWESRGYTGGSPGSKAGFVVTVNTPYMAAPNNYPNLLKNAGIGASVMAWGDPP